MKEWVTSKLMSPKPLPSAKSAACCACHQLWGVERLQGSQDIIGRKIGFHSSLASGGKDNVVHGENTLEPILFVDHDQTAHLIFRHCIERRVNVVRWLACLDLTRSGLCDCDFYRELIPCAERNCNIAVRYNSYHLSLGVYDRKHPQLWFHNISTAEPRFVSKRQKTGVFDIASLTFIASSFFAPTWRIAYRRQRPLIGFPNAACSAIYATLTAVMMGSSNIALL